MDDWENEDFAEIPAASSAAVGSASTRAALPPKKGKWDDEDQDDNVKESWDASDEEKPPKPTEKTASKTTTSAAAGNSKTRPATAKKATATKATSKAAGVSVDDDPNETPEERKRRLRKLETDADFENVQDLFGNMKFSGLVDAEGNAIDIGTYNPATREEFDQLAKAIVANVSRFEKHGLYVQFIETLSRELATSISDPLDVKKVASTLTALANEKQKLIKEKESKKKKAPVKKTLNRSEDIYDDVAMEGGGAGGNYDDEYDFM